MTIKGSVSKSVVDNDFITITAVCLFSLQYYTISCGKNIGTAGSSQINSLMHFPDLENRMHTHAKGRSKMCKLLYAHWLNSWPCSKPFFLGAGHLLYLIKGF